MLSMWIILLIAVVFIALGWVGYKINPVWSAVISLFAVLIIIGQFFEMFGLSGLADFIRKQSWIIAISGGYLIGNILSIFF